MAVAGTLIFAWALRTPDYPWLFAVGALPWVVGVILLISRWKGLRSLLSMGFSLFVIIGYIIPHILAIYLPNAPTELQGGFRIEHHNLFWYGLALKKEQSWMISAGLRLKQRFNIGYSFDIYTTPLSVYNSGSGGHEVMLRYDFIK